MRILALDVGEKRIGVARADSTTRIAVPVGYIEVNGSEWQEIAHTANLNSTNFFVIGLPRSNEGNETAQSAYVRNFAKTLTEKLPGVKICFQDESLTSVVAEERLKSRGRPYQKGDIDAEAAAVILQDFLESFRNNRGASMPLSEDHSRPTGSERASETRNDGLERSASEGDGVEATSDNERSITDMSAKKKRKKTAIKWVSVIAILVILALVGTGVVLWIKDKNARERAEYYAQLEAEMEPDTFSFTILPGQTIYEIKASMVRAGFPESEVEEAFNANYDFDFLKDRPAGATLEGYLYGETHEFYKTDSAKDVITAYLKGMGEVIKSNDLENKFSAQGLTLYEGITLASVVQKEAPTSEMPTVAQVFLSRLGAGMPLGSDVTVSYALDTIDPGRNVHSDNETALGVDSCYNTRLYAGLPCGPISNPGLAALEAVANPADSSYFYFLTGDDGLMYYSYTEAEHNQNVYSHCQSLCNVSL